jgi:glycosyltransferase involved in cell wall biosynthesis
VVLDDFIKEGLISIKPQHFDDASIRVVYLPVNPAECDPTESICPGETRVCFIGYRTAQKRFSDFQMLAQRYPQFRFLSVGGGQIENLATGRVSALRTREDFLKAIGSCDYAIFPYSSGYELSLSAAMLDAIAVGTHLVTLNVPCARALHQYFGDAYITIFDNFSDLKLGFKELVSGRALAQIVCREELVEVVRQSKFGQTSVERKFCDLVNVAINRGFK